MGELRSLGFVALPDFSLRGGELIGTKLNEVDSSCQIFEGRRASGNRNFLW